MQHLAGENVRALPTMDIYHWGPSIEGHVVVSNRHLSCHTHLHTYIYLQRHTLGSILGVRRLGVVRKGALGAVPSWHSLIPHSPQDHCGSGSFRMTSFDPPMSHSLALDLQIPGSSSIIMMSQTFPSSTTHSYNHL